MKINKIKNKLKDERGAAIVEGAIIIPVFLLLILIIFNITFWHIGETAANRLITTTQSELQNTFHLNKLFDEEQLYANRIESTLNSIQVNAGLLNPTEVRIYATGHNPSNPETPLNLGNYSTLDSLDGTFLELSEENCSEGLNCATYEYINNTFVQSGASGIIASCETSEVVLIKIEYDYTIDNIVFGDNTTQTKTAEAINKCE